MANTTMITDREERKKLKRAARKKAAPKKPRAGARGENKAKVKKLSRGQSKRSFLSFPKRTCGCTFH
jgi:hypothetical protein